MNILETSKAAGLPVKTVRYYADVRLVEETSRTMAGYRVYNYAAVHKLIFVRRARALGFSIDVCRKLLDHYQDEDHACSSVMAIALERLHEVEKQQQALQWSHDELSYLIKLCCDNAQSECSILNCLGKS